MITWTQFAVRRRVSFDRFVGGLPDTAESTISARLVELGVDPKTFPWHALAQPTSVTPVAEELKEIPADPAPPEAQDG